MWNQEEFEAAPFAKPDDFSLVNKFYQEFINQYSSIDNDGVNWYFQNENIMSIIHFNFTTVHATLVTGVKAKRSFLFNVAVNDGTDDDKPTSFSMFTSPDIVCQIEFIALAKKFLARITQSNYKGGYPMIGFTPTYTIMFK